MTKGLAPQQEESDGGFALFEVLVATAIAAVALAVIYGMLAGASRSATTERATVEASIIARSILAEVSAGSWQAPGEYWSDASSKIRWRLRIQPTDEPQLDADLQFLKVDLAIWHLGAQKAPLEFATEVFLPSRMTP